MSESTHPMSLDDAKGLLLARARKLRIEGDEDAAIEALLDREVRTPEPTDEECRRFHERNPERFRAGDLVEAAHILFAVTPGVPTLALSAKAGEIHQELLRNPDGFAEAAARYSNCPSAAQGGSLGQLGCGDTVPEFETALFAGPTTGVLPQLVASRHGFHIVYVARRIEGRRVDFDEARETIAAQLREHALQQALRQYLQIVGGNDTPLVQ